MSSSNSTSHLIRSLHCINLRQSNRIGLLIPQLNILLHTNLLSLLDRSSTLKGFNPLIIIRPPKYRNRESFLARDVNGAVHRRLEVIVRPAHEGVCDVDHEGAFDGCCLDPFVI